MATADTLDVLKKDELLAVITVKDFHRLITVPWGGGLPQSARREFAVHDGVDRRFGGFL
jgi:hypothetical protein